MTMEVDFDSEKRAAKYRDEFCSSPVKFNQLHDIQVNCSVCNECIISAKSIPQGQRSLDGLFTSRSSKAEFSHQHGQHIDNSSVLVHKISELYEKQDLSDIQVTVGHKVFHAHRLILSSSSDVFRVMLMNTAWPESRTDKITLKEEMECEAVFEDFLKYMYTCNIHLSHYTVLSVLMLADKYNVCDLKNVCIEYMIDHLVSTVEHNHSISWLQYANNCGHELLAEQCCQFISWNFHKIINTKDFLQMDKDILIQFLSRSDLVIPDEFTLFKGISCWLQHQKKVLSLTLVSFCELAQTLLNMIRFPMISPVHLSQLERDPLSEHFKEFFLEEMMNALNFHMGNAMDPEKQRKCALKPRNYTNDQWSTALTIDDFPSLPSHGVRPLLFSSPVSASQADDSRCWEWSVDLFPKGIHFQKCILIGLWRNMEVAGTTYNNVRLVLSTKQPEVREVDVAVLIKGLQDNVEYFKQVIQKRCMFDKDKQNFHFDDIVPYSELNCPDSNYLCGADGISFKILVIIKPILKKS